MELQKRHRCPKCGYEYEPWVEICPDCGVPVETSDAGPSLRMVKGSLDPNEDPRWTVVTNVPNAIIGNLIKNQLEDAGIPVLMQRAPSADIAQFSGNDYVPQDLRVPFHLLEDARRLLDSSPDKSAGAPFWGSDLDEDEDEDEQDGWKSPFSSSGGPPSNIPDGWAMLPTERDVDARQWHQRTHGNEQAAGRWSTKRGAAARQNEDEYSFDEEPLEVDKIRFSQPYEREYYDETSGGQSKWIRIFYGVLLLAISLPFLLQLFQQIVSFLNFR